jgi:hypothetical protein
VGAQEKPSGSIGISNMEQWDKYFGIFFKKIEISNLFSRQSSRADRRQDSSSTVVQDASSSCVMTASKAPNGEACIGEDLQRVLETPPE